MSRAIFALETFSELCHKQSMKLAPDHNIRAFVRHTTRDPAKQQIADHEAAGAGAIYVDGEGAQDVASWVRSLRPGNLAAVTTLDRIATTKETLRPWLAEIERKGAVIWEVRTGRRSDVASDAAAMVLDAITRKGHSTSEARRKAAKSAAARKKKMRSAVEKARRRYDDPAVRAADFKRVFGVSYGTMRRIMGRGRDVKPGPRPKQD